MLVVGLRAGFVAQGNLLVAWARDRNGQLQVASDFVEVLALRVREGYPRVEECVFGLEVNESHVKIVSA